MSDDLATVALVAANSIGVFDVAKKSQTGVIRPWNEGAAEAMLARA